METKTCLSCNQLLPLENFYRRTDVSDGHQSQCKKCDNKRHWETIKKSPEKHQKRLEYIKVWRDKHVTPELSRRYALKKNYGITPEQYDEILNLQKGRCAICGALSSGDKRYSSLVVDHKHDTGKIRGLLCLPCNTLIGMAKDNPEILHSAMAYLERTSGARPSA